jgi:hypothetical protein
MMEKWNTGRMGIREKIKMLFHYSIIPTFQYSYFKGRGGYYGAVY